MGSHHADFHPNGIYIYIGSAEGHVFVINKNIMLIETMINAGVSAGHTTFLSMRNQAMQVKLLRVIQENEVLRLGSTKPIAVDVRYLAATHRDPQQEIAAGRLRQDLYFRLNVVTLHIPSLAMRRDDIPLLAYYFLKKHALKMGKSVEDITENAMALLSDYDYPGNVRELENLIERGVALATGNELTVTQLPVALSEHAIQVIREKSNNLPTLDEREEKYIQWVLEKTAGNRTQAAQILGIDRVSLWRKLKKYGMKDEN